MGIAIDSLQTTSINGTAYTSTIASSPRSSPLSRVGKRWEKAAREELLHLELLYPSSLPNTLGLACSNHFNLSLSVSTDLVLRLYSLSLS